MRNKLPIKFINWYQTKISANTPPRCRHIPTCSNYAKEAYEKFNFFYASLLTTKRLLKCNRLFKCGYDPVPLTRKEKKALKQALEEENENKTEDSN